MAAISVQACGVDVHRSLRSINTQVQITGMGSSNKDMPRKYETGEENVFEAGVTGPDKHLVSSMEVDSDEADSEPEPEDSDLDDFQQTMLYQCHTSDDASTLHVPRSPLNLTNGSRPSSIATVKRTSIIELLSPTTLQGPNSDSTSSKPMPPFPNQSSTISAPSDRPVPTSSLHQSFYSDGVSSEDEYGLDMSFSIATPVAYYAPKGRPSLVSISPTFPKPGNIPMTRRQMHERTTPSRRLSNRSSSNRDNQPRTKKNKQTPEAHTQKAIYPGNSSSPASSIPSFSTPNWSGSSLQAGSSSESESQASNVRASSKRRPARLVPHPQVSDHVVRPRRMTEPAGPENISSNEVTQPRDEQTSSWYTKRRNEPSPVPRLRGIPASVFSTTTPPLPSATSSLDSPKTTLFRRGHGQLSSDHSVNFSSTELSRPIFARTRDNSPTIASHYPGAGADGPYHTAPLVGKPHPPYPITGLRDRAQSVSSMASSSSMSSHPTFDSASVRSTPHRYRQQFYSGSPTTTALTTTDRSSSRGSMSPVPKSYNRLGSKMSISTTNLGLFSTSASDMDSPMSNSRYSEDRHQDSPVVGQPSRKMSRPKSIKLFNGTSESVSRVGTKAIAGLGSILRRKSIAPEA